MAKQTSKKTSWWKILISIIAVVCVVFLAFGLTDGFTKNPFKKPPVTPPAVEKQIKSTTIITEKYGTFELPAGNMILTSSNNTIFNDGTDLSYVYNEAIEQAKKNTNEGSITEESEVVFHYNSDFNNVEDILKGTAKVVAGHNFFVPLDKKVQFNFTGENEEYKDIYPMVFQNVMNLGVTIPNNSNAFTEIQLNFYCESVKIEYNELDMYYSVVIKSDKGCPLTDTIYAEIMADSNTKITYNY